MTILYGGRGAAKSARMVAAAALNGDVHVFTPCTKAASDPDHVCVNPGVVIAAITASGEVAPRLTALAYRSGPWNWCTAYDALTRDLIEREQSA